jgi:Xaa-Pro aminopeptidase/Xaa-Pro dipeptidase
LASVQERLSVLGLDALLIFDIRNVRYLTGFTGSDGCCILRPREAFLLVDGRYLTQARQQARGVTVALYRDKVSALAESLGNGTVQTAGFESSAVTFDFYERLKERLSGIRLEPCTEEVERLRRTKDDTELALILRAVDVSHEALKATLPLVRPGARERDIAVALEHRMRRLGAEDLSFPVIVATGPHAAQPHAEPGDGVIRSGDGVIIDYGAVVGGYHSDETCTIPVGPIDPEMRRVYGIVREAHDRVIDAIRAGRSCRAMDGIARGVIEAAGFGDAFPHGTGHGVGLDVHEAPRLSPASDAFLEAGTVVTVEPGIYLPDRLGVRIEDMVLVEADGCRVLTKTSKDIKMIENI